MASEERPQYQSGIGTIGGTQFHWGSGTPGKYWSIPYGDYPVTPDAPVGAWAQGVGAVPIANNVIPDPVLHRDRIGIMLHPGSSAGLDHLYTQGCFAVPPEEWPAVKAKILEETKKGPLYLHVQPGGMASFTNTKTLEQASLPTVGTAINAANAPVAGALAKPAYSFALPENAPMGMGNNNPLNIKYYKGAEKDYPGLIGPSSNTDQGDPQMKFDSPEAGWAAAYKLLQRKYGGGKITPNMIIAGEGGWTPGNKQAAANVAKAAGIGPDDDINFNDPAKAQAFMRALVTQEQGAAGKAYPDAMIASVIGGKATPSPGTATAAAPTTAQSVWSKLTAKPTDAQGAEQANAKSPLEQVAESFSPSADKAKSTKELMEEQAPLEGGLSSVGPGARNVSPGLQNIAQTYGQTINSFSQPLTWNSAPPRIAGLAPAGFQPSAAPQVPGISLNSVQPSPNGLGYGIEPIGYGYG